MLNNLNRKFKLDYILLILINFIILYKVFHLKELDLSIPLVYTGDGLTTVALFKQIMTGEFAFYSVPKSEYLAAPFGYELYDFPTPIFTNWLVIKILSIFSSDPFPN